MRLLNYITNQRRFLIGCSLAITTAFALHVVVYEPYVSRLFETEQEYRERCKAGYAEAINERLSSEQALGYFGPCGAVRTT